jgi:hypothetical protein
LPRASAKSAKYQDVLAGILSGLAENFLRVIIRSLLGLHFAGDHENGEV